MYRRIPQDTHRAEAYDEIQHGQTLEQQIIIPTLIDTQYYELLELTTCTSGQGVRS